MHRGASASAVTNFSEAQQESVRKTLRLVLDSRHFSKSRRYSAMLMHVVLNSLDRNPTALKERMVGIEVFGRVADYDVANDPVVRIAAGEVRKRLSQFFAEHLESEVRIDLPSGGYTAEFSFGPFSGSASDGATPIDPATSHSAVIAGRNRGSSHSWTSFQSRKLVPAVVLLLLFVAVATWVYLHHLSRHDFWKPALASQQSPVIIVGKKEISGIDSSGLAQITTAGRTYLALDDTMLVAQLCSIFRAYNADCNIASAPATTLEFLRGKPIVLIGAFNNEWTLRMMSSLPYQIQHGRSTGSSFPDTRTIIEHKPTGDTPIWTLYGASVPAELGKDYALITRFHSDITNSMVVIIAGLGPEGTDGARQFINSPDSLKKLLDRASRDWSGINLEAVLQIDVVHGSPSRTEIVATRFW